MRYATRRRDETIPRHPIPRVGHEPPERTTSAAEEDAEAADYSREPLIVPRPRPPRASPRPPARLRRRSPFVFVRDELERRPSHPPHPPPPRGAPPAREPPPPPPPTPPPPLRGPPQRLSPPPPPPRRRSPPRPRPYPRSWTPPPRVPGRFSTLETPREGSARTIRRRRWIERRRFGSRRLFPLFPGLRRAARDERAPRGGADEPRPRRHARRHLAPRVHRLFSRGGGERRREEILRRAREFLERVSPLDARAASFSSPRYAPAAAAAATAEVDGAASASGSARGRNVERNATTVDTNRRVRESVQSGVPIAGVIPAPGRPGPGPPARVSGAATVSPWTAALSAAHASRPPPGSSVPSPTPRPGSTAASARSNPRNAAASDAPAEISAAPPLAIPACASSSRASPNAAGHAPAAPATTATAVTAARAPRTPTPGFKLARWSCSPTGPGRPRRIASAATARVASTERKLPTARRSARRSTPPPPPREKSPQTRKRPNRRGSNRRPSRRSSRGGWRTAPPRTRRRRRRGAPPRGQRRTRTRRQRHRRVVPSDAREDPPAHRQPGRHPTRRLRRARGG